MSTEVPQPEAGRTGTEESRDAAEACPVQVEPMWCDFHPLNMGVWGGFSSVLSFWPWSHCGVNLLLFYSCSGLFSASKSCLRLDLQVALTPRQKLLVSGNSLSWIALNISPFTGIEAVLGSKEQPEICAVQGFQMRSFPARAL